MGMTLLDRLKYPDIPEDWEITAFPSDVKHVYEELLWEIVEYDGETSREFVIIHDKTVYQIAVLLKAMQGMAGEDEGDLLNDITLLLKD